jgi:hypothetical protein
VEDLSRALAELAASEREQRALAQAAAERGDAADELARALEAEVADLGGRVAVLQSKLGAGAPTAGAAGCCHCWGVPLPVWPAPRRRTPHR